jgi:hypothetical protein
VALVLALAPACGWFASGEGTSMFVEPKPADAGPTCRPKEVDERGTPPWKAGDTTPSGWKVENVDASNLEFVRATFSKGDQSTVLEVAFNGDGTPGDWATEKYKLMPAPDATPPEELLTDAMAQLKTFAAAETGAPFVRRAEGVVDVYEGLPPCP